MIASMTGWKPLWPNMTAPSMSVLAEFLGFGLDHQHGVGGAGDDQIELRFRHLVDMRVEDVFAVDVADAGAADRAHEGNAGERQGGRGGDDRQDVRIVLEIVLDDGDDDLGVVLVAVGKERADRAVDQAGNQRFLLARTAFALEIAARDLAGGVGLFLVVDGQRKEVEARLRLLHRNDGGQHDGLAVGGEHGAVGLARDLAGFQDERTAAPFDFHFVVIEHVLSFMCGKGRARFAGAGPFPWLPLLDAATGKTTGARQSWRGSARASCNPAHDRPWRFGRPSALEPWPDRSDWPCDRRRNRAFGSIPRNSFASMTVHGRVRRSIPSACAPATNRVRSECETGGLSVGEPAGQFVSGADRASRSASDSGLVLALEIVEEAAALRDKSAADHGGNDCPSCGP